MQSHSREATVKPRLRDEAASILYISKIARVQVNDDGTPRRGSLLPATFRRCYYAMKRRPLSTVTMCRDASRVGDCQVYVARFSS